MIVSVAQVPSITFESSKHNIQVGKIKEHFDVKVFILFEKARYNFSNSMILQELKNEVTD
ncbi:hypothetical protein R3W88_000955 [Solanum pinnatisectum]|uniref:Uncharacterized protein n=1 Tax=Solanum pinnatisectum TaxID=50273 RepID=A0AAV9MH21_9SOLN|nr:hypothetical protein R3W88_000955 [Solanum pinnatisectum]